MFLSVIFLLSATGFIVFQSHCSCTGNEQVSLFVTPETCEDNFHTHHIHLQGGEEVPSPENKCHECSTHTKECGCNNIRISFFKLKDEVVFEKVRSKTVLPVAAIIPLMVINLLPSISDEPEETNIKYIAPSSSQSSIDFLITIQQLKIPHTA